MLKNLKNHGNIDVKLFKTPFTDETQKKIPFSRVDHAKFLLNEMTGFIGLLIFNFLLLRFEYIFLNL